ARFAAFFSDRNFCQEIRTSALYNEIVSSAVEREWRFKMTRTSTEIEALKNVLIHRWEQAAAKFTDLAEALPENQFKSRLFEGTRNPDEVLRHVAFWNRHAAESLRGKKADDSANELPEAEYATRARVLEALKASTADIRAALRSESVPL